MDKLDLASAFDLTLDEENESKFNALKILHARKTKSLIASIDAQKNEVIKIKALNKDNIRTQMIQALRKKVKDVELVVDVLKDELSKRGELTAQEVNNVVMKKTLGGPKRFRPLTREELETKIAELERVASKQSHKASPATNSNANTNKHSSSSAPNPKLPSSNVANGSSVTSKDLARFAQMEVDLDALKNAIEVKDNSLFQHTEEIGRLRSKNASLAGISAEFDLQEQLVDELQRSLLESRRESQDLARALAQCQEDCMQIRSEVDMEQELQGHDGASQAQVDKLSQQNRTLLKRLSEMEIALSNSVMQTAGGHSPANQVANAGSPSKSSQHYEMKIQRLQDKLSVSDEKCKALLAENQQINPLKDQLRDKNEQIRDLQRQFKYARGATGSPAPSSTADDKGSSPSPGKSFNNILKSSASRDMSVQESKEVKSPFDSSSSAHSTRPGTAGLSSHGSVPGSAAETPRNPFPASPAPSKEPLSSTPSKPAAVSTQSSHHSLPGSQESKQDHKHTPRVEDDDEDELVVIKAGSLQADVRRSSQSSVRSAVSEHKSVDNTVPCQASATHSANHSHINDEDEDMMLLDDGDDDDDDLMMGNGVDEEDEEDDFMMGL